MWQLLVVTLSVSRAPVLEGSGLLAHMRRGPATPVIVLDGNNIRGACSFAVSQSQLAAAASAWATEQQLPVLLCLDHGADARVWRIGPFAALTLSGSCMTADDVVIRDAWWARSQAKRDVFVVTADAGLASRARRLKAAGPVQVVASGPMVRLLLGEPSELGPPNNKEKTAERAEGATQLARELDSGPSWAAVEPEESSADDETEAVLLDYLQWASTEAPTTTRHTDPVVPSPSTKRRLRRKRHMRQYFAPDSEP